MAWSSDHPIFGEDDNYEGDAFVRNWREQTIEIASVNDDGEIGDNGGSALGISMNGRFVVVVSDSTNLVDGIETYAIELYLRDRRDKTTVLVSHRTDGSQGSELIYHATISPDGRCVTFSTAAALTDEETFGSIQIYAYDVETTEIVLVSKNNDGIAAKGGSIYSSLSYDGRFVAFTSYATNLDDREYDSFTDNKGQDVFLRDRDSDENGVFDETGGTTTERIGLYPEGGHFQNGSNNPRVTPDGRFIAFQGSGRYNRREPDLLYIRNRAANTTEFIGFSHDNKRWVNGACLLGGISTDARYVSFDSKGTNIVENDMNDLPDVFIRDVLAGKNYRITNGIDGEESNGWTSSTSMTFNGRFIAFSSSATNLVEDDTNEVSDVFLTEFLGCENFVRGDSNCDGSVDFNDIDGFIGALIDPNEYASAFEHLSCDWQCNNDIDGDGNVNFNDIDGFVECLINNGCP